MGVSDEQARNVEDARGSRDAPGGQIPPDRGCDALVGRSVDPPRRDGRALTEFWLVGAFFATVAAVQTVWAIAILLRPSALVYVGGVIVNAGIVAIWVASRTIGMPIGPEPWTPEPLGALDLLSTTLELLIIAGTTKVILAGSTRRRAAYRHAG